MNAQSDDGERLEDYAVDVRKLRGVHQEVVAKKTEIEALIAMEQNLGPLEAINPAAMERLKAHVDQLLEQWEKEKTEDGRAVTGSVAFNKLAQEHFDLEQKILDAQDEQVEEATEHPFEHPLR
ncbi:hypothetical protein DLM45_05710 [Hyphomicrobium methylovorum]|uniref:hypothetical protein n=1 Tax=Hyphomicrobium methylovorum TaxID=84 RepID=UPI0015E73FFC|nr:hypothetical protein [Hyphomicrobium methylovorum]MBA2125720.1 hypothetical protein [Hyphomicrobium methylovorum]